jgi:hypothetical protein
MEPYTATQLIHHEGTKGTKHTKGSDARNAPEPFIFSCFSS